MTGTKGTAQIATDLAFDLSRKQPWGELAERMRVAQNHHCLRVEHESGDKLK